MTRSILILTLSMCFSIVGLSQTATNSLSIANDSLPSASDTTASDTIAGISPVVFSDLEKKVAELMKIRSEEETEGFINDAIKLFNGTTRLENGGPPCISCHTLNNEGIFYGGFLGVDLTPAYTSLNGDNGLIKQLKSPADVRMKITFSKKPITDDEITMLILLLEKADKEKDYQIEGFHYFILLKYGLPGLALIFVIISLIWFKRKKNSVKKDIYDRQLKST